MYVPSALITALLEPVAYRMTMATTYIFLYYIRAEILKRCVPRFVWFYRDKCLSLSRLKILWQRQTILFIFCNSGTSHVVYTIFIIAETVWD